MQIRNIKGIVEKLCWAKVYAKKSDGKLWGDTATAINKIRDKVFDTNLDISECCEVDVDMVEDLLCEECGQSIAYSISRLLAKSGCIRWKEGGKR